MIRNTFMTRTAFALALICTGGLAGGVSPALGAFPGDNGKIAFDSDRDGDIDIWTMSPRGGNLVNLTANSGAFDGLSSWRADGRRLAFMSDRRTATNLEGDTEIFVMNADGSNQRQITFNAFDDEHPAWSPDGKRIVFARDFDPIVGQFDEDLFTMDADGTNEKNRTNTPGVNEFEPVWSPTGRTIAFASDRDGDGEIYRMRPNGSGVRQLTFNALNDEFPDWSPDGRRIAFFGERDGNFDIYTMRADGGKQTRLTFDAAFDGLPVWSPDGRQLTFASDRDGNDEIYTMRADGSHQVNRTSNAAFDNGPDWQRLDDDDEDHDDGDD
jgi:Tol biopolymer transport system component